MIRLCIVFLSATIMMNSLAVVRTSTVSIYISRQAYASDELDLLKCPSILRLTDKCVPAGKALIGTSPLGIE